jgi:hypothetical protein
MFGEHDSLSVHSETEEVCPRGAVELQTACYKRGIGDQKLDIEIKVWNVTKILLQHLAITRYSDGSTIVANFIMNESFQHRPILLIEACNVILIDTGEADLNHRNCSPIDTPLFSHMPELAASRE